MITHKDVQDAIKDELMRIRGLLNYIFCLVFDKYLRSWIRIASYCCSLRMICGKSHRSQTMLRIYTKVMK